MTDVGFSLSGMNWFDYLIAAIIFGITFIAFFKGLVRTMLFISTWFGSMVAAFLLYPKLVPHISGYFSDEKVAVISAAVSVFIVSLIVFFLISYQIKTYCKDKHWGIFDKSLGLLFGLVLGVTIACTIFLMIARLADVLSIDTNSEAYSWYKGAKTYNALRIVSSVFEGYIPDSMNDGFEDTISSIKKTSIEVLNHKSEDAGVNNLLDPKNAQTMYEVIQLIPETKLKDIYAKYDLANVSDDKKREVFSEILTLYKQSVLQEEVSLADIISGEKIFRLEEALIVSLDVSTEKTKPTDSVSHVDESKAELSTKKDDNTGYQKDNLHQLDRLIENVE
jgi:membrane protein required for colicin V production